MATQLTPDRAPAIQTPEAQKFSLMQRQAQLFAQSPLIPQHLRQGTPEQAMANCYIAMTIADRMGEDRMTVMQNIHIVHGTAGFRAQYMIARANASGKFRDSIDWEVEGTGKNLSVTAFATLASTGRRVSFTVSMAMAEAEGWTKNSKYKTLPELMLRYRSGTFLVRLYAPEVMLGYQTVEESEDIAAAAMPVHAPLTGAALLEQARTDPSPGPHDDEANAAAGPNNTGGDAGAVQEGQDTVTEENPTAAEGPGDEERGEAHSGTEGQRSERQLAEAWLDDYETRLQDAPDKEACTAIHKSEDERSALLKAKFPDLYEHRLDGMRPADAPEKAAGGLFGGAK